MLLRNVTYLVRHFVAEEPITRFEQILFAIIIFPKTTDVEKMSVVFSFFTVPPYTKNTKVS